MGNEEREALGAWVRYCGGYFMRAAQGEGGKLVRFKRILQWLMAGDDGLPRDQAVDALIKPLEMLSLAEISGWLYMVDDIGYARLVNDGDNFKYEPVIAGYAPIASPDDCGVRGAIKHAKADLDGVFAAGVDQLAVPVTKAHALYGWGTIAAAVDTAPEVMDAAAVDAALAEWNKGAVSDMDGVCRLYRLIAQEDRSRIVWPDRYVEMLRDVVDAHGHGGNTYYGRKLGISPQRVGQLIGKLKAAPEESPNNILTGLGRDRSFLQERVKDASADLREVKIISGKKVVKHVTR